MAGFSGGKQLGNAASLCGG
ncbi:unnamed protein product [Victoria cruziana]